ERRGSPARPPPRFRPPGRGDLSVGRPERPLPVPRSSWGLPALVRQASRIERRVAVARREGRFLPRRQPARSAARRVEGPQVRALRLLLGRRVQAPRGTVGRGPPGADPGFAGLNRRAILPPPQNTLRRSEKLLSRFVERWGRIHTIEFDTCCGA